MMLRKVQRRVHTHAVRSVVVTRTNTASPFNGATWGDVFGLMQERFAWEEQDLALDVFDVADVTSGGDSQRSFEAACAESAMLVAVGIEGAPEQSAVGDVYQSYSWPVFLALDSASVRSRRSRPCRA